MISNQLTDDSQILFRRAVQMIPELAPFLTYDHDPYIVSAAGRLLWVWDAYTLTNRYPNAQPLDEASPFPGRQLRAQQRQGGDGRLRRHGAILRGGAGRADPAGLVADLPGLFEPMSAMPAELQAHLRFPEDLFIAQNQSYRLYHLPATEGGATNFYNQEDRWAIPEDVVTGGQPMEPYYVIMRLPARRRPSSC